MSEDYSARQEPADPEGEIEAERHELAQLVGKLLAWDWLERRRRQEREDLAPERDVAGARAER